MCPLIVILPNRLRATARAFLNATALLLALIPLPAAAAQNVPQPSWQQEYWARFDDRDWDAAIASAEQLVAAARPATAATGLRLSEALSLLGSAQLSKGNLVAAEAAFTEALQLAEQYSGRSSASLIDPLRGLGFTLAAAGKHDQAIPYMDRALLLSRRTAGLFDLSQQGLLRQLTASLTAVGSAAEGERHLLYLRRIGEHAYGANDPRLIPILCVVGDWYVEVGQVDEGRRNYRAAIGIAQRRLEKNSLGLVEPLRSFAASYPREIMLSSFGLIYRGERPGSLDPMSGHVENEPMNPRYLSSEGERALLRALEIARAHPDASAVTVVGTLVQTGDWFVMKQQPAKAMPYYEQAAGVLAQSASTAGSEVTTVLSFPVQIYYPTPTLATRNLNRPDTDERFVQLEFTVQADSTVTDVVVTDKNANDRQTAQVVEALRAARYRPKFVDGKPVATTAVGYRQVLKVRKTTQDAE